MNPLYAQYDYRHLMNSLYVMSLHDMEDVDYSTAWSIKNRVWEVARLDF